MTYEDWEEALKQIRELRYEARKARDEAAVKRHADLAEALAVWLERGT